MLQYLCFSTRPFRALRQNIKESFKASYHFIYISPDTFVFFFHRLSLSSLTFFSSSIRQNNLMVPDCSAIMASPSASSHLLYFHLVSRYSGRRFLHFTVVLEPTKLDLFFDLLCRPEYLSFPLAFSHFYVSQIIISL